MRGKNRIVRMGEQGQVQKSNGPDYQYIYEVSTVQDPKWWVGDVVELPDGREFVYSLSTGSCAASASGNGVEFTDTGAIAITTLSTAQSALVDAGVAGVAKAIEIPAATHLAFTVDQLRGGYAVIYNGTGNDVDFRQIIGNDASLANTKITIYLDAAVTQAVTTSSKIEVFLNPYSALRHATSATLAKAGVPAASSLVTASGIYFWTQVKGFMWVPPQALVGANGGMGCFWRADGSIESTTTALGVTVAANDLSQYAGHTIAGTAAGSGPLFNMNR